MVANMSCKTDGKAVSADEVRVTCILAKYCDAGSLADALVSREFPRRVHNWVAGMQLGPVPFKYHLKGVSMTLLDVALALRHLHSFNLLHRVRRRLARQPAAQIQPSGPTGLHR
ncbi:hypothetical protein Vretifemale_11898 [Volvox reticuliferus]|uniref:Protein kinase domain-containing protein n=1 Tax=Volvox reticuliferus TaxID=1737510 RepID=A0A8J4CMY9_9CHLO|nr:hypothetical protein Vretifemale_11898 [Volvox reticuliferus]